MLVFWVIPNHQLDKTLLYTALQDAQPNACDKFVQRAHKELRRDRFHTVGTYFLLESEDDLIVMTKQYHHHPGEPLDFERSIGAPGYRQLLVDAVNS